MNKAVPLRGDGGCVGRRNPHPGKKVSHQRLGTVDSGSVRGRGAHVHGDGIVRERQVIVEHHLCPQ